MEKAYYCLFVLWLLSLQLCLHFLVADCGSAVRFLPGFQGPLPFEMETGYIGVGEAEEVQLFYYFVKSERNAKEDPLLLWLTGGPGCSTLSAFLYEIGPLAFQAVEYNGSLPTLILNPHSWTKMSSIIFVDMPVGTGFSYATTQPASHSSDSMQIRHGHQFLRKWIMDHPEFGSNKFYVGGDSYSGIVVPAIAQLISQGNEEGIKPHVNLQGYLVGNGVTDPISEGNSQIPYAHGMAIISDELYESLKTSCGGEYQYELIDPTNKDCFKHLGDYYELIVGLNTAQILEPVCAFASPKPVEIEFNRRRSLFVNSSHILDSEDQPLPEFRCRNYGYLLCSYWIEDDKVRKALHIREGTVDQWVRCNFGLQYTKDIGNSVKYHAYLSTKGYRSLIYSGDHDMAVPFLGTQEWVRSLNYSIVDEWRPWLVRGQIAGYTRTYANRMTFATVKGGGHTAPEYSPAECNAMYQRWIFEGSL